MNQPQQRLGTLWLRAQRRALKSRDFLMEMMLRDVEGKLEERIDVGQLRRDPILMFALLGDPATRLRLPEPLVATVTRTDPGWQWQTERPPEGRTPANAATIRKVTIWCVVKARNSGSRTRKSSEITEVLRLPLPGNHGSLATSATRKSRKSCDFRYSEITEVLRLPLPQNPDLALPPGQGPG